MSTLKDIPSNALCAWIVAYRTIGALKEESKDAMRELLLRKEAGDTFDFDSHIKTKIKEVTPEPSMSLDQLVEAIRDLENEH